MTPTSPPIPDPSLTQLQATTTALYNQPRPPLTTHDIQGAAS